jgi:hypothetical protein
MTYEELALVFVAALSPDPRDCAAPAVAPSPDLWAVAAALQRVDGYRNRHGYGANATCLLRVAFAVAAQLLLVPLSRLRSRDRRCELCVARWLVAYVLRAHGWTLRRIGDALGLDRTTVLHRLARIAATPELFALAQPAMDVVDAVGPHLGELAEPASIASGSRRRAPRPATPRPTVRPALMDANGGAARAA